VTVIADVKPVTFNNQTQKYILRRIPPTGCQCS